MKLRIILLLILSITFFMACRGGTGGELDIPRDCIEVGPSGITEDTIWDGCYNLNSTVEVDNDALLTIKAGSTISFDEGKQLNIKDGALIAVGTEKDPITFTGMKDIPGYWYNIRIGSNDTRNELRNVIIQYGGGGHFSGSLSLSDARLKMSDSLIQYSGSDGFSFSGEDSVIEEFKNITSTKNKKSAGIIDSYLLHYLDNTSDFTGNLGDDYLTVDAWDITFDTTWKSLTVPVYITDHFAIKGALVTIEPGSTFIFGDGAYFSTGSNDGKTGALKAIATPESPITFKGLQNTPGYWGGINLGSGVDQRSELAYVNISDGGGYYNGNITIGTGEYANIHDGNISNSLKYGIWLRSSSTSNDDISTSNIFLNNASGDIGNE